MSFIFSVTCYAIEFLPQMSSWTSICFIHMYAHGCEGFMKKLGLSSSVRDSEVCVWMSLEQSRNCMSHKHMKRCSKFVESHLCTSRGWPKFHLTILGTFWSYKWSDSIGRRKGIIVGSDQDGDDAVVQAHVSTTLSCWSELQYVGCSFCLGLKIPRFTVFHVLWNTTPFCCC